MTVRRSSIGAMVAVITAAGSAAAQSPPAAPSSAAPTTPSVVDMLFERQHLGNVPAGQELVYRFERVVTRPDLLGQPFDDAVKVAVRKVAADETREVEVAVFSGERARAPQVIDGLTGNPILVVFLDRSVASYMAIAGGKLPYLKARFRDALREGGRMEPVKVKLGDRTVDAVKVTITPYAADPNAGRMQGYQNARFSLVVSEAVPGHFVEMIASYDNADAAAPRLEERLAMVGSEVVK